MSLKLKITPILLFLVLSLSLSAQKSLVEAEEVSPQAYSELLNKFKSFELFEINTSHVNSILRSNTENREVKLKMTNKEWHLRLFPNDIRSSNFAHRTTDENGNIVVLPRQPNSTYMGELADQLGSRVRMSVTENMILGLINTSEGQFFIENASNLIRDRKVSSDLYIVYNTADVIEDKGQMCGMEEVNRMKHEHVTDAPNKPLEGDVTEMSCYEAIVGLAHDVAMVSAKGGAGAAESFTIGILNLVQTNYDDEFFHEVRLTAGPLYSASGSNPGAWNYGSIGALLSTWGGWANGGGMGTTAFDVATLWTGVNLSGGVIGVAWLNAICGGRRYNVCENYTGSTNGLRNLQAHELGHNFSLTHDASGSPTIMAPSVNGSNTWSGQSISQMNSKIPYGCMFQCSAGIPPDADFVGSQISGCVPMVVNFTDLSLNTPTDWFWIFPGGTPATSTQQNPTVVYNIPGRHDVTLEATNGAGTDVETKILYILADDVPIADYQTDIDLDEVYFIDRSIVYGTANYLWDFGDGEFANDQNPFHIYECDGIYLVTLTVTNACGTHTYQNIVEIVTPPTADFDATPLEGCVGTVVEFTNESTKNVTIMAWTFENGTPSTSKEENPTIVYDTGGVFQVQLLVRNTRYADTEIKTMFITIDSAAVAGFGEMVDSLTVEFDNTTEYGRTYEWMFGDSTTSDSMNPMHTYEKDSMYDVTLISTNFCNSDTFTKTITVGAVPTADFDADSARGCLTHTVTFEDKSSANTTRRMWIFEGGSPSTSTEEMPIVTYDTEGEYKVTLIAKNGLGNDTVVVDSFIVIQDEPTAAFSHTRSGFDVDFMNESDGGDTYTWDFGDGNGSMEENPMHTYAMDGEYTVILIIQNDCGTDTIESIIKLNNSPSANFVSNKQIGCVPLTIQLENRSSGNSDDFEWRIPGGSPSTSTDRNPEVTFNAPGLYRISLVASNNFGKDTLVRVDYIEVLDVPTSEFSSKQSGFTVEFTEETEYGKEFLWDFGDMETSTSPNPVHVYADEGQYTVTLTAKNDCGEDVFTMDLDITPKPNVEIRTEDAMVCAGTEIQFTDESGGDPTSWLWTFEGGDPATSMDQNPLVMYNTPGVYDVTVEVTNQYGTTTRTYDDYVTAFGTPESEWDYTPQGIRANFENLSTWYQVVAWDFGDGSTSDEFEPSHLYARPGTYDVELLITNPCGMDLLEKQVTVDFEDLDVVVFAPPPTPNPTGGLVKVAFTGVPSSEVEVIVTGANGLMQTVYTGTFQQGNFESEIDLSHLSDGSYMLFIKTEHEVKMHKVIVQR